MVCSQSTLDEQPEPYHQHLLTVSQYSKARLQQSKQTQQTKPPQQSSQHQSERKLSPSSQYPISNAQQSNSNPPHHTFTLQQSEQSPQSPQPQQNTEHLNAHYQRPSPGSQYPSSVTSVSTSNAQRSEVSPRVMPCLPATKQVHFSTSPSQPIHKTSPTNSTHSEEDTMLIGIRRKICVPRGRSGYGLSRFMSPCGKCRGPMFRGMVSWGTFWRSTDVCCKTQCSAHDEWCSSKSHQETRTWNDPGGSP